MPKSLLKRLLSSRQNFYGGAPLDMKKLFLAKIMRNWLVFIHTHIYRVCGGKMGTPGVKWV